MKINSPIQTKRKSRSQKGPQCAFSLIETVLALGIVSFAMMTIMALLPVGLTTFKEAVNVSVESTIVQRLSGEIQSVADTSTLGATNYYFDEQGMQVSKSDSTQMFTSEIGAPKPVSAGTLAPFSSANQVTIRISNKTLQTTTNTYSVVFLTTH